MSAANEHPVEALSAFLDGEVTDCERASIEAHLAACGPCRDLLEDLRCLDRAVAEDEPPPVPTDLASRIHDAIASEMRPASVAPAPVRRWGRGLPLAAAACLLAAGFIWLMRLEPPRTVSPAPVSSTAEPVNAPVPPPPAPPPPSASAPALARWPDAKPKPPERKRSPQPSSSGNSPLGKAEARKQDAEMQQAIDQAAPKEKSLAEDAPPDAAMLEQLRSLGYIGNKNDVEAAAVEAPPYRVRLLENRQMSVETAGYTCAVTVSQEDATTLAAIVRTVPAAAPQVAPSATAATTGVPKAAVVVAPRVCAQLSPDDCRYVLSLIRERYRDALQQRCGPPPR